MTPSPVKGTDGTWVSVVQLGSFRGRSKAERGGNGAWLRDKDTARRDQETT